MASSPVCTGMDVLFTASLKSVAVLLKEFICPCTADMPCCIPPRLKFRFTPSAVPNTSLNAWNTAVAIALASLTTAPSPLAMPFSTPAPTSSPISMKTFDGELMLRKPLTAPTTELASSLAFATADPIIEPMPLINPLTRSAPAETICPAKDEMVEMAWEPNS